MIAPYPSITPTPCGAASPAVPPGHVCQTSPSLWPERFEQIKKDAEKFAQEAEGSAGRAEHAISQAFSEAERAKWEADQAESAMHSAGMAQARAESAANAVESIARECLYHAQAASASRQAAEESSVAAAGNAQIAETAAEKAMAAADRAESIKPGETYVAGPGIAIGAAPPVVTGVKFTMVYFDGNHYSTHITFNGDLLAEVDAAGGDKTFGKDRFSFEDESVAPDTLSLRVLLDTTTPDTDTPYTYTFTTDNTWGTGHNASLFYNTAYTSRDYTCPDYSYVRVEKIEQSAPESMLMISNDAVYPAATVSSSYSFYPTSTSPQYQSYVFSSVSTQLIIGLLGLNSTKERRSYELFANLDSAPGGVYIEYPSTMQAFWIGRPEDSSMFTGWWRIQIDWLSETMLAVKFEKATS